MGSHFEAQRIQVRDSALARRGRSDSPGRPRSSVRTVLWVLIILFSLVLAAQLVVHFLVSPRAIVRSVVVQGDDILSPADVAAIAGFRLGDPLMGLDLARVQGLLESQPPVRHATVHKRFPDTLVVDIEARRGLALALVSADGLTVPVVFDEEGLIFSAGPEAAMADLPILSGLLFARWQPGTRLPAVLRPLLADLRRLQEEEPALFAFISEVEVTRSGERDLETLIYPAAYVTPIRAGGRLSADLLKNAALLLDVVRREGLEDRLHEVDLRTREVVYRERSDG